MPIYEYRCDACGHELEKLQRMSEEPLRDCPDCGQSELRRLVSAAGFRLKGGGWYETDFKQDSKRNLHDSHAAGSGGNDKVGADRAGDQSGAGKKDPAKPAEVRKPSTGSTAVKPSTA